MSEPITPEQFLILCYTWHESDEFSLSVAGTERERTRFTGGLYRLNGNPLDVSNVTFAWGHWLPGADLAGLHAPRSKWLHCLLDTTKLQKARLDLTTFHQTTLWKVNMQEANLFGSTWSHGSSSLCLFQNASSKHTHWKNWTFCGATTDPESVTDLSGVNFSHSRFEDCDFRRCRMHRTQFIGCEFLHCDFSFILDASAVDFTDAVDLQGRSTLLPAHKCLNAHQPMRKDS